MEDLTRYKFNSNDLLFKVFNHRKTIIIISVLALIISTIVSFIITPKYLATTTLLPAPSISISRSLLSATANIQKNSMFGEDEEVEHILQVLNSEELQMNITKRFNLIQHYDIDPKDLHLLSKLNKKWEKHVSFGRTQFMAIEISVLDKDPKTAALMANAIASNIDTIMNKMEKERSIKAYQIAKNEYDNREKQIKVISDSLRTIMEYGITDIQGQSTSLNRGLTQALISGNKNAVDAIERKLKILSQFGNKYLTLRTIMESLSYQLSLLNAKCNEAKVDAEQTLTHIYVVDRAVQPDKKAYPQRILIIIISTLSTFLLSILIIFILDAVKDFKNKEIASLK